MQTYATTPRQLIDEAVKCAPTPAEEHLLFACARQHFDEAYREMVLKLAATVDWQRIYLLAYAHGIAPLVHRNLEHCLSYSLRLPEEVQVQFADAYQQNRRLKLHAAEAIVRVLAFFQHKGIDVMLLTSTAADFLVYTDAASTFAHDVDLLLRCRKKELGETLAREIAQFLKGVSAEFRYFTCQFGIDYEFFEWDLYAHHDLILNGVLPLDFQQIWQDAPIRDVGSATAYFMSPEDFLIASCISSARKRYFRLKNMVDIAEIVKAYTAPPPVGLDWQRLLQKTQAYRCGDIVYTALYATQAKLGCSLLAKTFARLAGSPSRAFLIQFLAKRMSFSNLSVYVQPLGGQYPLGRRMGPSLLLPYVAYTPAQLLQKFRFVWHTRRFLHPD